MTTGALVSRLRRSDEGSGKYAFFMATATGPCRFGQYGLLQRLVLNRLGYGDVPIMAPCASNAYQGMSQRMRKNAWHAILAGDVLFKCACKVRPYEVNPGETDALLEQCVQRMERAIETDDDMIETSRRCVHEFAQVPTAAPGSKPLVGVVGEIYVRCNPYSNDFVVRRIEQLGGEAWLTPISEWIVYTAHAHRWEAARRWLNLADKADAWLKNRFLTGYERKWYESAAELLYDRHEPPIEEIVAEGERLLPQAFSGEAIITLGRAALFPRQGARLIVNVAPFSCMPGTITAALGREVQARTNVPIVSMFYDGEEGINQRLEVFLRNLSGVSTPAFGP